MNTLEQVLLLEQKVESAVEKIKQLQAENDALRSKCAELTNALSSKSEQLQTCVSNNNLIQGGIQKALDQLSTIENSILDKGDQVATSFQPSIVAEPEVSEEPEVQSIPENENQFDIEENTISNEVTEEESEDVSMEVETENDAVSLESKIEEQFNASSPAPLSVPNFFGAPIDYDLPKESNPIVENNTFDTMEPVPESENNEESSVIDFDESFPSDFDPAFDDDSENQNNEGKIYW